MISNGNSDKFSYVSTLMKGVRSSQHVPRDIFPSSSVGREKPGKVTGNEV